MVNISPSNGECRVHDLDIAKWAIMSKKIHVLFWCIKITVQNTQLLFPPFSALFHLRIVSSHVIDMHGQGRKIRSHKHLSPSGHNGIDDSVKPRTNAIQFIFEIIQKVDVTILHLLHKGLKPRFILFVGGNINSGIFDIRNQLVCTPIQSIGIVKQMNMSEIVSPYVIGIKAPVM